MENKTHIVILGLLNEQPLSGYDIKKRIDLRFRFFWNESYGQIYPQLKKLEKTGLIKAVDREESGRSKQRYSITSEGREVLHQWLRMSPEKESVRIELLLKMYFTDQSSSSLLADYINTFQASHLQDLILLKLFKRELESIPDPHHNHQNIISVIEFGVKTNQAYLEWCSETLTNLEKNNEQK